MARKSSVEEVKKYLSKMQAYLFDVKFPGYSASHQGIIIADSLMAAEKQARKEWPAADQILNIGKYTIKMY